MGDFLLTAMSGWIALAAFAMTLIVPLGIKALRIASSQRRRFMTLHFVLGFAVPLLALAHAAIPMGAGGMLGQTGLGLTFAMAALVLLFLQAALGVSLRGDTAEQPVVRRAHLATMATLATLIVAHILINRA